MENENNNKEVKTEKGKEEEKLDLGERMKKYESDSLTVVKVEPWRPFIVRLDGRSFSNFTGGLRKPFDINFAKAMVLTTADLLTEFTATTGYTHSDEITLIFRGQANSKEEFEKLVNKPTHIFDGRVIKILTNLSGYCSVRFNYHLTKIINSDQNSKTNYKSEYIERINEMKACFDARILLFPEGKDIEIVNHQIWRSVFDCERNAVSTYARSFFTQKQVQGKKKKDMIEMLKEKGLDWEENVELFWRHGVYLKKETYELEVENKKVLRTKICCKSFKIRFNDFFLKYLLSKYYEVNENETKEYGIENFNL